MRVLKKIFAAVSAAVILALSLTVNVTASGVSFVPDFDVYSKAAYLLNLDTGEVVYQKNADEQYTPASLTKIMTAVLVLEHFSNDISALSTTYVSGDYRCFDELYMTGCSTADIQPGERVSYKDLLYALMLRSACEAANIIAINMGGSLSGFADMMNLKAAQLGMENTHFTNSHGLFWENHYSSAHDMAILTDYAMSLPMFAEIACAPTYTMEETSYHKERLISHTVTMMSKANGGDYYYEYVKGIKTGTLDEAGRCLVTTAYKDGYSYLLVTLGAPQKDESGNNVMYNFIDAKNIYQWAFKNLEYTGVISVTEEIAEVPVEYGDGTDYVIVRPSEEYSRIWNKNVPIDSVYRVIDLKKNVVAPVKKGDVMGTIQLQYGGQTLTTIDLVATSDVGRSEEKEFMAVAQSFIGSPDFFNAAKYSIAFFVVYTVLIIVLKIVFARENKKRSRMYGGRSAGSGAGRRNGW